ncbi:hypothetical protein AGR7C_Lc100396 [Agrobacterium deltaense Zutra 3/1]|uniref:Uncharacterized protein n=1 Tax=Agrobacterium deltaense Zutra 3/1 TaxID=1183427 RepID=A0A1S7QXV3_9HYPH|nr:hypothetical protein AGR7C_Lc100396 [Agrobacterium deltaense Zutra 3/1]
MTKRLREFSAVSPIRLRCEVIRDFDALPSKWGGQSILVCDDLRGINYYAARRLSP